MTSWTDMPLAAFDIESTGPEPRECRIVSASLVTITASGPDPTNWLLDPGEPIPEGATAVHGITTEQAQAEGQDYLDGVAEIRVALDEVWAQGFIIAIYNASYDMTVMDHECQRLGFAPMEPGPIFDPMVVDKKYDQYRKGSRKLDATCFEYNVSLEDAHSASGDALAAARLAWRMPRVFPMLARFTTEQLQEQQTNWYRDERARFIKYRERIGEPLTDTNLGWPIRGLG